MGINSMAKTSCVCSICGVGVSFEGCAGEGGRGKIGLLFLRSIYSFPLFSCSLSSSLGSRRKLSKSR